MENLTSIQLLSMILLLVGVGLAFSQIQLSGWVLGWLLLSGALLLQGFRSMLGYVAGLGGVDATTYTIANDWMGLGFSLLVVAAMQMMRQVFTQHRLAAESLRVFSAAANDAILILDNTGKILIWNQAAQRVFGYEPGEAQGRSIGELIIPQPYRTEFENLFNQFGRDGRVAVSTTPASIPGRHKDGTPISTEYAMSRIVIDGKWYAIYIVRDISARRQVEETLGRIRRLEGLISICMSCKKIRGEDNDWQQLEKYICEHSDAVFSHGICPGCLEKRLNQLN